MGTVVVVSPATAELRVGEWRCGWACALAGSRAMHWGLLLPGREGGGEKGKSQCHGGDGDWAIGSYLFIFSILRDDGIRVC